jgi:esterase/lipase superfamily enzyme
MDSLPGMKLKGDCKFQIEGWPNCIPSSTTALPAEPDKRRAGPRRVSRPDSADTSEERSRTTSPRASRTTSGQEQAAAPPPPQPRPDRPPYGLIGKVRTYERIPMLVGSSMKLSGSRRPSQQFALEEDAPGRLNVIAVTATVPLGDGSIMRRPGEVALAKPARKWWPFRPAERPSQHFTIEEARPIPTAAVGQAARTMLAVLPGTAGQPAARRVLVYFHGFNSPCDYAQYRAAQMAFDTAYTGALAAFCWPTDSSSNAIDLRKYPHDLASASRSVPSAKLFLHLLINESQIERIEIAGFSMGARIAIQAAKEIIVEKLDPKRKLKGLYLAAADEDQRTFRDDHLKAFTRHSLRVVLYASEHDGWISLSESLHKAARVGSGGRNLLCAPGVEAVETSQREAPSRGHDLFAVPDVLEHLRSVLEGSRQATALSASMGACKTANNRQ